ncbi:MAG: hypothetical protein GQ531_02540 [Sulfurovum sp.]|nr:hypothetical protein [Sulfurovum sp.]
MMQLNDILEENSIKAISQKTKIPEEHLEALFANKFESLKRVKTMGFISILEREYGAELTVLSTAAKAYYDEFTENKGITLEVQMKPEKKGKSKLLSLIVLLLLGGATWYFLTQFDQKHFDELLEFIDQNDTVSIEEGVKDLSIASVVEEKVTSEDTVTAHNAKSDTNESLLAEAIKDVQEHNKSDEAN